MRIDKYLKISRLIKRRTVAKEIVDAGRVKINGRIAKPGTEVRIGDILEIGFGVKQVRAAVLAIREAVRSEDAASLYEILDGAPID